MSTEKTETKTDLGPELESIRGTRHPLALAQPPSGPGYHVWQAPPMTNERKEFLKRQFTPTGCTDLEFEFFLAYCERTQLDPVIKQAYLVERKQKVFKDGRDVWVSKFEPMSAEQGMAARADAEPDFRGIDDGVVYEGDVFKIDYAAGLVIHTSEPLKRGRIVGAWAHAHREGRRVPITWLKVEERIQTKGDGNANIFWSKMTATQILKCARAEQWRQAYPNIFGGQYVPEEIDTEEIDVTPPNAEEAKRPTTDKLADAIKPKGPGPSSPPKKASPPSGITIDAVKPEAKTEAPKTEAPPAKPEEKPSNVVQLPSQQAAASKAAPPDPKLVTVFGDTLAPIGTEYVKLEAPILLQLIALGETKLPEIKNATRSAQVRLSIDAMTAERKRREDALLADVSDASSPEAKTDREPGSDDGEF